IVSQVLIDVVFLQAVSKWPLHAIGVVAVAGAHGDTALVVLGSAGGSLFRRVGKGAAAWVAQVGWYQGAAVQAAHIQLGTLHFAPHTWCAGVGPAIRIIDGAWALVHHHRGALLGIVRAHPVDAIAEGFTMQE